MTQGAPSSTTQQAPAGKAIVEIQNVSVQFPIKGGFLGRQVGAVHAVNDVSLSVYQGETLGLVGESGSGKTTLGRAILRLVPTTSGSILFNDQDVTKLSPGQVRPLRRQMQMVFQDPFGSLDPRMTVFQIVSEPLVNFGMGERRLRRQTVQELLRTVGLNPDHINRYPHEFSGGQRQRVGIARALALRPQFIVADEPVSALDVSIQMGFRDWVNVYGHTLATNKPRVSLFQFLWIADYPDPQDWCESILHSAASFNLGGFRNPTFDHLAVAAAVEPAVGRRAALYREAQRLAVRTGAWIAVSAARGSYVVRSGVRGMTATPDGIQPRHGNWAAVSFTR